MQNDHKYTQNDYKETQNNHKENHYKETTNNDKVRLTDNKDTQNDYKYRHSDCEETQNDHKETPNNKKMQNDHKVTTKRRKITSDAAILCFVSLSVCVSFSRGPLSSYLSMAVGFFGVRHSSYLLIYFHIRIFKVAYLAFIYYTE